jgi:hypothetical protein
MQRQPARAEQSSHNYEGKPPTPSAGAPAVVGTGMRARAHHYSRVAPRPPARPATHPRHPVRLAPNAKPSSTGHWPHPPARFVSLPPPSMGEPTRILYRPFARSSFVRSRPGCARSFGHRRCPHPQRRPRRLDGRRTAPPAGWRVMST